MEQWQLENPQETRTQLEQLTKELTDKLALKNRLAVLKRELADISLEYQYFQQNQQISENEKLTGLLREYSANQVMTVYSLCKEHAVEGKKWRFWDKVKGYFNYGRKFVTIMSLDFGEVADNLLNDFYQKSISEYTNEQQLITEQLETYTFDSKLQELADLSMAVFKDKLSREYSESTRKIFEETEEISQENPAEFVKEYPVVLSSTYSIKNTLQSGFTYDYVIVDEASQVDLATGVLAMSCGHNLVIVGDDKQLPMVPGEEPTALSNQYWDEEIDEAYRYTKHSLLSSACLVWKQAPIVLLKEHYRCHPQIINFCNKKFYNNELIIMTEEKTGDKPLVFKKVPIGNHERDNTNQREIDIIKEEILPQIKNISAEKIGVITPYKNQVVKLKNELPIQCEVATVHAFQGREKDTIIISTVSNNTSKEFVNDPKLINVAVSRAVKQLIVVTSSNKGNDKNHYGDLMKYIDYQTMGEGVTESKVQSIFDYLYKQYFKERQVILAKHKKISQYDSENLMHLMITDVLNEKFPSYDCAYGVILKHVVRSSKGLSKREVEYLNNPLTHIDFLIFNRMNKEPVLAIEVDGVNFHKAGSKQAERDQLKNNILKINGLPLVRMKTDGSGEREQLIDAMEKIVAL
ncbi:AAA domain-containing protein [Granulicatella balaenopterae]|uniref:AAA domain-containing protein n=1 Tax=Granulicatella balaenopterae TaxID=137733 RepID=A0A1H9MT56_9LACT|nr:AAA domain-containing protein [Granulicatella balaenopterae]SER26896.1 AAA domain-containing protein [Granulicatella balaenopterae]